MNKYHFYKLPNKMPVILVPTQGTSVAVFLYVRVGSRYETAREAGIAHFIEHMHFKGTEKRPTYLEINRDFDALGAEYNAFTGKEETGYYIKCAPEEIESAFELLSDVVFHSTFPGEEMAKEKQVILEELKMYEDNPRMRLPHLLDEAVFGMHPLGRNIVGTVRTVRGFTREEVCAFQRRYYVPGNMVLTVAGKFFDREARKAVRYYFGLERRSSRLPKPQPYQVRRARSKVVPFTSEQATLGLSFPSIGDRAPAQDRTALAVVSMMLGGGMSSRLFMELREKRGLCYSIGSSIDTYCEIGSFQIFAGLDRPRLSEALVVIASEIRAFAQEGATREEFERARRNIRGKFLLALEDPAEIARGYAGSYLSQRRIETPQESLQRLERVTMSDIVRMARKIFHQKKLSAAMIGKVKEGEFEKMIEKAFGS